MLENLRKLHNFNYRLSN